MVKKCVYCSTSLSGENAVDVCERCGVGVWGEKMFQAIKDNMNAARDSGDLHQGNVGKTVNS